MSNTSTFYIFINLLFKIIIIFYLGPLMKNFQVHVRVNLWFRSFMRHFSELSNFKNRFFGKTQNFENLFFEPFYN